MTELEKARQQKEVGHLHSFVMGACGALNHSEHRFVTKAASLIMEWCCNGRMGGTVGTLLFRGVPPRLSGA
eukprot:5959801-Prymnesium_polylepis.1